MNLRLAAALAAVLWGFTYVISTTILPPHPVFIGAVRALGGAIPLLLIAREMPPMSSLGRIAVLGTLNGGLFFGLLFVAALRLPGGVASTFQALGPLFAILLAWPLLGQSPTAAKIVSVLVGALGVALIVFKGGASIDLIGASAALGSAASVALGGILMNRWGRPPISLVGFTAWQLVIAGIELSAFALLWGDLPVSLTGANMLGLAIVAVVLTALPFTLWFKAIGGMGAAAVTPFLLLTPVTAFVIDAAYYGLIPAPVQALGVALVVGGLVLNQRASQGGAKPPVQPAVKPA